MSDIAPLIIVRSKLDPSNGRLTENSGEHTYPDFYLRSIGCN